MLQVAHVLACMTCVYALFVERMWILLDKCQVLCRECTRAPGGPAYLLAACERKYEEVHLCPGPREMIPGNGQLTYTHAR